MNNFENYYQLLKNTLNNMTTLDEEVVEAIVKDIPLEAFKKGDILLHQGNEPLLSYYVLKGCVRQFVTNDAGKEVTVEFYTEEQSINVFSYSDNDGNSRYSLSCIEDCVLVACPQIEEQVIDEEYPELQQMLRSMFQDQFTKLQINLANFKVQTPEERFKSLLKERPELFKRVPQHVLASYLDITPETFSRFKKRFIKR